MMGNLSFEGNGREYFKIWIVNILLTIVTFGIYYPWAKVRNLRYLYGNTTLAGRNFDYHATGKQLFFGYLVATGILIIYTVIQRISLVGGLFVLAALLLSIPWIIWRSLKFRLRMTSYSNVRFGFDGECSEAYLVFFLLPLLCYAGLYAGFFIVILIGSPIGMASPGTAIALGIIALICIFVGFIFVQAFLKKKNSEYFVNGYRFGQGEFSSSIETKPLFIIQLKSILLSIVGGFAGIVLASIFVSVVFGVSALTSMQGNFDDPEAMDEMFNGGLALAIIGPIYAVIILVNIMAIAYLFARHRAYIYSCIDLDGKVTFESTLRARSYVWVMITNFLLIIVTLGFGYPWAKVRMTELLLTNTKVETEQEVDEYITQKQDEQSSLGEQIGDAFDIDVGIGI